MVERRGTMNGERCVVLRSSPRVWPRTLPSGSSRAGRVGRSVLRLVRKELHRPAWQVELCASGPNGSRLIGPHKCTVPGAKQELRVDKRTEQRIARGTVETPPPLR